MDPVEALMTVSVAVVGAVASGGQLRHLRRHGTAGVSSWTWTLITAGCYAWAVDMAARGLWATAAVDVVLGTLAAAVALSATSRHRARQLCTAGAVVATVAVLAISAPTAAAVVLASVTVAMYLPQFVSGVRLATRGGSVEGVSVGTWALNAFICVLWLGWGLASEVWHAVGANLLLGVMATTVAVLAHRGHRQGGGGFELARSSQLNNAATKSATPAADAA
jgi:hypothetical protein